MSAKRPSTILNVQLFVSCFRYKSFLCILAVFFLWSCLPSQVFAVNEFSTTLTNIQTISADGKAHIEKKFVIKNNLSTVYIKKYGVEINSNKIENIRISGEQGTLHANVVKTETSTTIGIDFPDQVVGKDKQRNFTISYDDPDAAIVSGNVLEVYVPKIADPENFASYTAILKVPSSFGKPTIATPPDFSETVEGDTRVLRFESENNLEGISVIFGEQQFFDFSIHYNLKNSTSNAGLMQIALPPDTQYQKVKYADIQPRPEEIEVDEDGNWIATYELDPNETQIVTAKGITTAHLEPLVDLPIIQPQIQHISTDNHWEVSDPIIENIAHKYTTPREIFDFVVDSLDYSYDRLSTNTNRYGAKAALEHSTDAVCQEYTDLFITLARANKIPARQATGYAYTNNSQIRPLSLVKDVLHAWPEYFDEVKQVWVPVDPTWTSTTGGIDYFSHLDFNHFVFAYQGLSSERPYPAGAYRDESDPEKNVYVNVTDTDLEIEPDFAVSVHQPVNSWLALFEPSYLLVTNTTGIAQYNIPIKFSVQVPLSLSTESTHIERLLPFQKMRIPITVKSQSWLQPQQTNLTIQVGEKSNSYAVLASSRIHQLHLQPIIILYILGAVLCTLVLLLIGLVMMRRGKKKKR